MAGHPHHRVGRPRPHPSIPVAAVSLSPFAVGFKNQPPASSQIPATTDLSGQIEGHHNVGLLKPLPLVVAPSPAPPGIAGSAIWPPAVQSQIPAGSLLSGEIRAQPGNGLDVAHLLMCSSAEIPPSGHHRRPFKARSRPDRCSPARSEHSPGMGSTWRIF